MDLRGLWTAPFPSGHMVTPLEPSEPRLDSLAFILGEVQDSTPLNVLNKSALATTSGECSDTELIVHGGPRKKAMPRKGHTKSRQGCYSCKRRRIKCPETKPQCQHCVRAGLSCEYPKSTAQHLAFTSLTNPRKTGPTVFSLDDFRYFHHFLVQAYPHLPIGADVTWTTEVPAIANQYSYLMKAMLALGASHLGLLTDTDLKSKALAHRVDAMKLLSKAIARPAESKAEADARFATFMVLVYQSSCLAEGFTDFMTLTRGARLVLNAECDERSAFKNFVRGPGNQADAVNEAIKGSDVIPINPRTLEEAGNSLVQLGPLCSSAIEKRYHSILTDLVADCYESSDLPCQPFILLYDIIGTMSHSEFQALTDCNNPVGQLLLSHFLAAHVLLRYEMYHLLKRLSFVVMYKVLMSWVHEIDANVPPEFKHYNDWPRSFMDRWSVHMASANTEAEFIRRLLSNDM